MKSMIVEVEAMGKEFHNFMRESKPEVIVVEGHLSHLVSPDMCFVLRLRPDILEKRLKARRYSKAKMSENVQAEILDVIYTEALENCKRAMQINATEMAPAKIAERILNTLRSKKYRSDKVDWSKRYQKYLK
jgi:adenylate kinase